MSARAIIGQALPVLRMGKERERKLKERREPYFLAEAEQRLEKNADTTCSKLQAWGVGVLISRSSPYRRCGALALPLAAGSGTAVHRLTAGSAWIQWLPRLPVLYLYTGRNPAGIPGWNINRDQLPAQCRS
jgi:hypothetical protein